MADLLDDIRRFYLAEGPMTALGDGAVATEALPRDLGALCRVIQGVLLHEQGAPAYGFELPPDRRAAPHLRPVARMLEEILRRDPRPLGEARPPQERLVGVCRHFSLMLCAI